MNRVMHGIDTSWSVSGQSRYGPVVARLPTAKAPMALRLVKAACDQMPA